MKKIIGLLITMLVLTYLGQNFSGYLYKFQAADFTSSLILIKDNVLFVALSNLLLYLLEMWRLSLIGKAFNLKLTVSECFGAISLNILFAWITPGAILGAPALAYFLFKKGHPLAESITVAFIRSFSIIFVSALTTIAIYTFDFQGQVENKALQEKIFFVLTGLAVYISFLVILSYLPEKFLSKIKFVSKICAQIRSFFQNGKWYILPILLLGLMINFVLVSFIPFVSRTYFPELGPLLAQTLLFLSYMLLMPTPGASGLAEVGAPMIFSQEIPVTEIISIVTAMRISTIGPQVGVGLLFMFYFFKRELSFSELNEFKNVKIETSSNDSHVP